MTLAGVCHPRGMTDGRRSQLAVVLGILAWVIVALLTSPLPGILTGVFVAIVTWVATIPLARRQESRE